MRELLIKLSYGSWSQIMPEFISYLEDSVILWSFQLFFGYKCLLKSLFKLSSSGEDSAFYSYDEFRLYTLQRTPCLSHYNFFFFLSHSDSTAKVIKLHELWLPEWVLGTDDTTQYASERPNPPNTSSLAISSLLFFPTPISKIILSVHFPFNLIPLARVSHKPRAREKKEHNKKRRMYVEPPIPPQNTIPLALFHCIFSSQALLICMTLSITNLCWKY